jgi:hypothetical protein
MATELKRMRSIIGSSSDWGLNDIILGSGELAFEVLVGGEIQAKVGDGVQQYSQLTYFYADTSIPLAGTDPGENITGALRFEGATVNGPVDLAQVDNALGGNKDAILWDSSLAIDTSWVFRCQHPSTNAILDYVFDPEVGQTFPASVSIDPDVWTMGVALVDTIINTLQFINHDYQGVQTEHSIVFTLSPTVSFFFHHGIGNGVEPGYLQLPRDTVDTDEDFAAASKGWVEAYVAAAIAAIP